jgi:hypothetical protein
MGERAATATRRSPAIDEKQHSAGVKLLLSEHPGLTFASEGGRMAAAGGICDERIPPYFRILPFPLHPSTQWRVLVLNPALPSFDSATSFLCHLN